MDQSESAGILSDEPRDDGGAMHRMPVHNEIDPTANGLEQSCEELHKDRCTKPP